MSLARSAALRTVRASATSGASSSLRVAPARAAIGRRALSTSTTSSGAGRPLCSSNASRWTALVTAAGSTVLGMALLQGDRLRLEDGANGNAEGGKGSGGKAKKGGSSKSGEKEKSKSVGKEDQMKSEGKDESANAEKQDKSSSDKKEQEVDEASPIDMDDLSEEASQQSAFDPETNTINWDCPCLGGMADGPCGENFKAAFSCFVFSEEEPKGVDCIDKFKDMQDCFRKYPEHYKDELEIDEEDEGEDFDGPGRAEGGASSSSKQLAEKDEHADDEGVREWRAELAKEKLD